MAWCPKCGKAHFSTHNHRCLTRPANAEMVEGFMDGYDLTAPEPSANRSASYRHGFMCGRIDKGLVKWSGTPGELVEMANKAMDEDAIQQTPGA